MRTVLELRRTGICNVIAAIFAAVSASGQIYVPPLTFQPVQVYCTVFEFDECRDSSPNGVDIADIIGGPPFGPHPDVPDGFPEVAVCNTGKSKVTVFRNTGNWTLPNTGLVIDGIYQIQDGAGGNDALAEPYDLQFVNMRMNPDSPAMDPFTDIVVSVRRPNGGIINREAVNILWNDGNGRFDVIPQTRIELDVVEANGLNVADVDADGKFDIVVAGNHSEFEQPGVEFPQVDVVRWINAAYDVDHYDISQIDGQAVVGRATDVVAAAVRLPQIAGRLDFVLSMSLTIGPGDRMGVFLNDGDTDSDGFPNWTKSYPDAVSSEGVVFGKLRSTLPAQDAVLATASSINTTFNNRAFVEQGNGLGVFVQQPPGSSLTTLQNPFGLDIGKLSPDQNNDLVIACRAGIPPGGCAADHKGGVAVLLGQADGTFHSTIKYFASELVCQAPARDPLPTFVRIGDLNNDGQNDVVASNNSSRRIGVLINNTVTVIPD